jgi:hypothetical protein
MPLPRDEDYERGRELIAHAAPLAEDGVRA